VEQEMVRLLWGQRYTVVVSQDTIGIFILITEKVGIHSINFKGVDLYDSKII
jgi:hypothetical protein